MTRSLIDIIENTPIAFRPMLKFYKPLGNDNYIELTAKGMMRPFTFDYNGITMRSYGVALSTDCDNMGKTLLHEYLHIQDEHMPEPEIEQLEEWMDDGGCEATDGCWVEPDGVCEHGCNSWLIAMGLI